MFTFLLGLCLAGVVLYWVLHVDVGSSSTRVVGYSVEDDEGAVWRAKEFIPEMMRPTVILVTKIGSTVYYAPSCAIYFEGRKV